MLPEPWFKKEIKLIDRNFEILRFPRFNKWFIVRRAPGKMAGLTEYHPRTGRHYYVDWVLEDEHHNPLVLTFNLQAKIIKAIRRMKYKRETRRLSELIRESEAVVEKRKNDAHKLLYEGAREMRKDIYRYRTTRTFNLGGKHGYLRKRSLQQRRT